MKRPSHLSQHGVAVPRQCLKLDDRSKSGAVQAVAHRAAAGVKRRRM